MAHFQSYEDESQKISQFSVPFSLTAPLGSNWTLRLYAAQMSTTGEGLEDLSGLTDAKLILGYSRRVGSGSVVVSLGANLPSGKKELTREEFDTVVLISQRAFDFRVPSLGQGLGFSPSITWARPIAGNTAIGLGASYQVRGGYRPLESLDDDYTPGNELLLTAGMDTRLNSQSSVSVDVTHATYAADRLGDSDIFDAGPRTSVSVLFRNVRGFNELRLAGSYRHRAKSEELENGVLVTETIQTTPDQALMHASYRMRARPSLDVTLSVQGRLFSESKQPKRSMLDVGVEAAYVIAREISLVSRFVYTAGTISGFEAAAGMSVTI
jgi:hypothetical protein